jgi:hypothetical protein
MIMGRTCKINTGRCAPDEGYGTGCIQVLHLMDKSSSKYVIYFSEDYSRLHYLGHIQSPSK